MCAHDSCQVNNVYKHVGKVEIWSALPPEALYLDFTKDVMYVCMYMYMYVCSVIPGTPRQT